MILSQFERVSNVPDDGSDARDVSRLRFFVLLFDLRRVVAKEKRYFGV